MLVFARIILLQLNGSVLIFKTYSFLLYAYDCLDYMYVSMYTVYMLDAHRGRGPLVLKIQILGSHRVGTRN